MVGILSILALCCTWLSSQCAYKSLYLFCQSVWNLVRCRCHHRCRYNISLPFWRQRKLKKKQYFQSPIQAFCRPFDFYAQVVHVVLSIREVCWHPRISVTLRRRQKVRHPSAHDITWQDLTWNDIIWHDMTWHDIRHDTYCQVILSGPRLIISYVKR